MVEVYENSGLTGTTYKPSDAKHPMTGYYLTEQELRRKDADIGAANYDAKEAKRKAKDEIARAQGSAASQIREAQEEANKKVSEIKEAALRKIQELEAQIEHERALNENLKRVATERANKARNINKHDKGYLVLNWQPFHYKRTIKEGRSTAVQEFDFYKITVQTPWDCSLPEGQIEKLVLEAINEGTLKITNVESIKWFKRNISLDAAIGSIGEDDENSLILNRQYRSNAKDGFWEVTFVTNFEPTVAAKHRKKYS